MKTLKLGMIIFSLAFGFSGCKKEVGPQGPSGANGADGINGINGANGANGTNGINGNANVVGTNEITLTSVNWAATGSAWSAGLTANGITQNIVDKGIVQVFIKYGNSWWALPDISGGVQTTYGFGLGVVTFYSSSLTGGTISNPGTKTFRVVIITPTNISENPNVDWSDYKQVKQALNF